MQRPDRMLAAAAALMAAFGALTVLVALEPASPPAIAPTDDAWRRLVLEAPTWAADASQVLKTVGAGIVMVPLRVLVALWLLARRRRQELAAWLIAWVVADVVAFVVKPAIGRVRPDLSAATSFPSAHAKTAAQVAVGLVLVGTGSLRARTVQWIFASLWIVAMAISRTVLDEHWVSDVVAGSVLGMGCAIGTWGFVLRWRSRRPSARASTAPR